MRTKIASIAAASIALILGTAGALASEPDARDWSASIGTGHAMNATAISATPAGSPASPHWSASIGTGQITGDSNRRLYATTSVPSSHAPSAHWTSKIGSARATDSNTNIPNGKVTS